MSGLGIRHMSVLSGVLRPSQPTIEMMFFLGSLEKSCWTPEYPYTERPRPRAGSADVARRPYVTVTLHVPHGLWFRMFVRSAVCTQRRSPFFFSTSLDYLFDHSDSTLLSASLMYLVSDSSPRFLGESTCILGLLSLSRARLRLSTSDSPRSSRSDISSRDSVPRTVTL